MPQPESEVPEIRKARIVLLTGASGYVGGRLIPLLEQQPVTLRCLARSPERMRSHVKVSTEIVRGDVRGQRPLKCCSAEDFHHEVFVPTTTAAFHYNAVATRMLLQQ